MKTWRYRRALACVWMAVTIYFVMTTALQAAPATGSDIGVMVVAESGWGHTGKKEDHPLVKKLVGMGIPITRIVLVSPALNGESRNSQVRELASALSVPGIKRWIPITLGDGIEPLRSMMDASQKGLEYAKASSHLVKAQSALAEAQKTYQMLVGLNPNTLTEKAWAELRPQVERYLDNYLTMASQWGADQVARIETQIALEKERVNAQWQKKLAELEAKRAGLASAGRKPVRCRGQTGAGADSGSRLGKRLRQFMGMWASA